MDTTCGSDVAPSKLVFSLSAHVFQREAMYVWPRINFTARKSSQYSKMDEIIRVRADIEG